MHDAIGTRDRHRRLGVALRRDVRRDRALGLWFAGRPCTSRPSGFSSALFVGIMVLAALTLLPALLGILGRHINRLPGDAEVEEGQGRGHRLLVPLGPRGRGGRAWLFVVASLIILLVLAAPALSMRLGFTTDADAPAGTTQRDAYDLVTEGFGAGSQRSTAAHRRAPQGDGRQ